MKKFLIYIFLVSFISVSYAQDMQYELSSLNFSGNENLSATDLYDVVASKETPNWFSKFLNSFSNLGESPVYFDTTKIQTDINLLQRYYQANGYFKSKIKAEFTLDSINMKADLTYDIFEGTPAFFDSVNIGGLESVSWELRDKIKEFTNVDTTVIYRDAKLISMKDNLIRLFKDHGYMLARGEIGIVKIDTMKNIVQSELNFTLGSRYRVNEIRVTKTGPGKDLVEDQLVKEIVNIKPDNYYSYYDIQQGQVRLYRTNLFSSALISGIVADTSGNYVPLNINTDIGLLYDISPEIIVNNQDDAFNLGIGLGLTKKNFLGNARQFTISLSTAAQDIYSFIADFSLSDTTLSGYADGRIILEQPYFFGKPINTKLEVYTTLQKRRNEWNAQLYGAKVSLDFELPRYTYFNSFIAYLNWESSNFLYRESYYYSALSQYLNNYFPPATVDSILSQAGEINTRSETNGYVIGFDLGANKTNDFLFPTSGYYINLVVEDGNSLAYLFSRAIGQDINNPLYAKLLISSAFFPRVFYSKESALGIKLKFGNIFTFRGDKARIPFNQRFYAGGSNSVRGWRSRGLAPNDSDIDLSAISNEDFQDLFLNNITPGGFFLVEGSVEARLNIAGAIGSALFVDFGNTFNSYKNFQFNQIAVAAGFGIRYYSSLAPLRLDFGFKVYDPDDKRSMFKKNIGELIQIHFGIGEAF